MSVLWTGRGTRWWGLKKEGGKPSPRFNRPRFPLPHLLKGPASQTHRGGGGATSTIRDEPVCFAPRRHPPAPRDRRYAWGLIVPPAAPPRSVPLNSGACRNSGECF